MMKRAIFTGTAGFLLGAMALAFAQSTGLRPDQFIALPWTWPGAQTFGPVVGGTNDQTTATTYVLTASDCGKTILSSTGAGLTITTLNSLVVGCAIAIVQQGSAQVTIANGSGATMASAHSFTKTFGQWATIGLFVDSNSGGSAAHFVLTGDGA